MVTASLIGGSATVNAAASACTAGTRSLPGVGTEEQLGQNCPQLLQLDPEKGRSHNPSNTGFILEIYPIQAFHGSF